MNCLVVYADVVWLLNACIDFLLLLLTATVLKKKIKKMEACVRGIYRFNYCYFCLYSFCFYDDTSNYETTVLVTYCVYSIWVYNI
ncbi:sigma-E processing peptidase SpoIIGA [Bacillus cereus]